MKTVVGFLRRIADRFLLTPWRRVRSICLSVVRVGAGRTPKAVPDTVWKRKAWTKQQLVAMDHNEYLVLELAFRARAYGMLIGSSYQEIRAGTDKETGELYIEWR